jgi:hypothetical protein
MRGKVIKLSAKHGIFIQLDKNNQICDLFHYDRTFPKEERVRERIRGLIFDLFHGQPLYTAWKNVIEFASQNFNSDGTPKEDLQ